MKKSLKLFFVVNVDWFFLSHRLPIAKEALKRGYDVTVLAIEEENRGEEIRSHGLRFIPLPSTRGGMNAFNEVKLVGFLYSVYKREKPDIVHHVAIKPVLYGSIAAKYARVPKIVNAISGLGSTFINPKIYSITYQLIRFLYKFSFRNSHLHVILQNKDDIIQLQNLVSLKKYQIHLIRGSGVDLEQFIYRSEPEKSPIRVLLLSRMLWDKGIGEFERAANRLKIKYNDKVEFILAGKVDLQNKSAISIQQLERWNNEGNVHWIGFQQNVIALHEQSHISVLPSYREGLPKSLIEALAIGRPVVTTDVPGCREVVRHNINGLLVRSMDIDSLIKALDRLISNKELRLKMGKEGRRIAEENFSINRVVEQTFSIYEAL